MALTKVDTRMITGGLITGSGDPNGLVTASPPAIFLRSDGGVGTTLYVKESGTNTNTGWVAYTSTAAVNSSNIQSALGYTPVSKGGDTFTGAITAPSIAFASGTQLFSGTGAPTVAAPVGSIYMRSDGTAGSTIYVKETGTGSSGWVPYSPSVMPSFTQATLPAASGYAMRLIYVSDGTTTNNIAFSDGSNWRWLSDGSTIVVVPAATAYQIKILSPADSSLVSGFVTFKLQGLNFQNVEIWDINKTVLARGIPDVNGNLTLTVDSTVLPNGSNTLTVWGWDVAAWVNGGAAPDQQPSHSDNKSIVLSVANGTTSTMPTGSAIKIMTLGDSITAGQGGSGASYRPTLKTKLETAGFTVTYVGHLNDGTYAYEGYPGEGVDNLKDYVNINNILSVNPDAISLLIGTNDNSGYSGAKNAPAYAVYTSGGTTALMIAYGQLLDAIYAKQPNVAVFVCKLTPRNGDMFVDETAFNSQISSVVNARATAGKKCYLVDTSTNFPSSTGLADGLHPNDSVGYPWLGDTIATAIKLQLGGIGGSVSTSVDAPSYAQSVGVTKMVMNEDFTNTAGIDMNDTRTTGYNLYRYRPFGNGTLPTSKFSVANSILTITGDGNGPNYSLATVGGWNNGPIGIAPSGKHLWRARLRFNRATRGTNGGWPSWWTMSAEHLFGGVNDLWFEGDYMEFLMWKFGGNVNDAASTTHKWPDDGGSTPQDMHTYAWPDDSWHNVDGLFVPATSTSAGYLKYYLDGTLVGTTNWTLNDNHFSIGNSHHLPGILGTDEGWAMDCDYLQCWTA